jgi:hypothetical protein
MGKQAITPPKAKPAEPDKHPQPDPQPYEDPVNRRMILPTNGRA